MRENPNKMARMRMEMAKLVAIQFPDNQRDFFLELQKLYYKNERELHLLNITTELMHRMSHEYDGDVPDWKMAEVEQNFRRKWEQVRLLDI